MYVYAPFGSAMMITPNGAVPRSMNFRSSSSHQYAIEIIFRKIHRYGFEHDSSTELNQLQYTQCVVTTEPAISTHTPSAPLNTPPTPSPTSEQQDTEYKQLSSQEGS